MGSKVWKDKNPETMEGDFIKINEWLLPLSWLYGLGVRLRNFCFDVGLLKSHSFDIPVISVGNITVGGTGKTPHVEYLVSLLRKHASVAVLSRGYKRKSHGFIIADSSATARLIGDEPMQMKKKFGDITVAVDRDRVNGIRRLTDGKTVKDIDVVLLDDAFQHRYVKPGINILLVDYHRLIIYDKLLPAGRLREPLNGKNRADIVIVTKCPKDLKPMEFRVITKAMNLFPYQHLYFTTFLKDEEKRERENGIRLGLRWLEEADEVWVFGDTISEGMAVEIARAKELAKPVRNLPEPSRMVELLIKGISAGYKGQHKAAESESNNG